MKNAENLVQVQKSNKLPSEIDYNSRELTAMPKRSKNSNNTYFEDAD